MNGISTETITRLKREAIADARREVLDWVESWADDRTVQEVKDQFDKPVPRLTFRSKGVQVMTRNSGKLSL